MKEIVLDTETTGISVKDGHRIVEIACIELENLIPTGQKFNYCINPERKVSEKAFEIHGYTDEYLSKQKKFIEIKDEFLNFIENKTLIIHNAEFDVTHLNNELLICKEDKISNKIIDTLILARNKFPGSQVSLDALCKRYRIDNSKRIKHNALLDCALLSKVYINLIDQKEPTLNFNDQSLKNTSYISNKVEYFKKVILPSVDEIKMHKEYLNKNLKKNYFN
tara:strand:+ start:868 stop:1533 length:666 start_codon:yes stop_codon:yes gene_type:complete